MINNLLGTVNKNFCKIISFFKINAHIICIFILWILLTVSQFIWLRLERIPPMGDGIRYILRGMDIFTNHFQMGFWGFFKEIFKIVDTLPPFVDITYFFYYKFFGFSTEIELIVNSAYIGMGIIGVYGIGKYLFNKNTGLLAALIFTSFPGVLIFSRLGYREFHIMCSIAITMYFLLKTENFINRRFSVLFGVSMGILLLIKYEGLVFIGIPILIELTGVIHKRFFLKRKSEGVFVNIMISLILVFIIGLLWYISNWEVFFIFMKHRFTLDDICFHPKELGLYASALLKGILYPCYTLFFVVTGLYSLFMMVRGKNRTDHVKRILLVCFYFVIPFLFFTFFGLKEYSHMLPLLPFVCVVIAAGYNLITVKFLRKYVLVSLIFAHIIPIHILPFIKVNTQTNFYADISISPIDRFIFDFIHHRPSMWQYVINPEEWDTKIKGILDFIKNDYSIVTDSSGESSNKKPTVLLLANSFVFRFFQVEYYNNVEGKPVDLISIIFPIGVKPKDPEECIFGHKYDYILMEDTDVFTHGNEDESLEESLIFIRNNLDRFDKRYCLINQFVLPGEQSTAILYKRIN